MCRPVSEEPHRCQQNLISMITSKPKGAYVCSYTKLNWAVLGQEATLIIYFIYNIIRIIYKKYN